VEITNGGEGAEEEKRKGGENLKRKIRIRSPSKLWLLWKTRFYSSNQITSTNQQPSFSIIIILKLTSINNAPTILIAIISNEFSIIDK
jgi:hypothetical protein